MRKDDMRKMLRGLAFTLAALSILGSVTVAARADENLQSASISAACSTAASCTSTQALKTIARQYSNAQIQISGCPSSTYNFVLEYSLDGVAYTGVNLYPDGTQSSQTGITSAGVYNGSVPVYSYVQVRASSFSGSACNVTLHLVPVTSTFSVSAAKFTKYGTVSSVPADGSAGVSVTYPGCFPSATNEVLVTLQNNYSANPWALTVQTTAFTSCGFTAYVAGGPSGSTVTIAYEAKGA